MSHQPKVISNSSNPKSKNNNEAENTQHPNSRETNPNRINLNNKQIKRSPNYINNTNNHNNSGNSSPNRLKFLTFFDKKYAEEENTFSINSLYTFGSNEMGQIGCEYDSKDINSFSSLPIYLAEMTNKRITSISAGDGHSVCVGKDGIVYAWGASACGK